MNDQLLMYKNQME